MPVSVIRGTNDKPAATSSLITAFLEYPDFDGELLIGFPILGAAGAGAADAFYVSRRFGAVMIDLVEGTDAGDYGARQDDMARLLQRRLLQHKELVERRLLLVKPECITFAPALSDRTIGAMDDFPPVANSAPSLLRALAEVEQPLNEDLYQKLRSAIQNISTIRRARTLRKPKKPNSLGAKLVKLEDQIATLDPRQSEAVLVTVEGVQRIRGLAGSGKTIVLALKAAYLHAQHPDWRIAVTFNTRSLHDQFRRLITNFVIEQAGEEPDWNNLRIINAWGGRREESLGLYAEFCQAHQIEIMDFSSAQRAFGRIGAFGGACEAALSAVSVVKPTYDAILVDEAQDLPPSFLRLCRAFLTPPKRLVYAYDELQNLSGEMLPSPQEIFGRKSDGEPEVQLGYGTQSQAVDDIVLQMCYRNSRPVLVTAHALGFGVYRSKPAGVTTSLVQIFDRPTLWHDIGYELASGRLESGKKVVLKRTPESSPRFLESHSEIDQLVQFRRFDTLADQNQWVATALEQNVKRDELRYEDVIVINPNPVTTRDNVAPIRGLLAAKQIGSHVAGVDTASNVFFARDHDSVTFTGIYRAKGNEAGMVYVVNAQEGMADRVNLAVVRNRLFTAMTRSKAWVRVLGVGPAMAELEAEFDQVKAANFELRFRYPTPDEMEQMRVLHREVSSQELDFIQRQRSSVADLIQQLADGRLHLQDLDSSTVAKLRRILDQEA